MNTVNYSELFTPEQLTSLLPPGVADEFFEALFGDASEGSYDIELSFAGARESSLDFELLLHERPGHCLACNLTYGLPDVFSRHRVIDLGDVVRQIDALMTNGKRCGEWRLGRTQEVSRALHVIPLIIDLVPGRPV